MSKLSGVEYYQSGVEYYQREGAWGWRFYFRDGYTAEGGCSFKTREEAQNSFREWDRRFRECNPEWDRE